MDDRKNIHDYYVDEAGDLTLFNKQGKVLVGTPGCSKCFILGVAHLADSEKAANALDELRQKLFSDPYFKNVPSMRPESGKTALFFHAKDDLPEVRREVFRLLPSLDVKAQIIFRRKHELVKSARDLFSKGRKLTGDIVYDDLVKRLFKNLLHKADKNHIVFARRGKTERMRALETAIQKAKRNFANTWDKASDKPTTIKSGSPHEHAGLQVIDYYLWALQRMLERGEDRFFELLRPGYRLIIDLDDTRKNAYGEYYSDRNPLGLDKLKAF